MERPKISINFSHSKIDNSTILSGNVIGQTSDRSNSKWVELQNELKKAKKTERLTGEEWEELNELEHLANSLDQNKLKIFWDKHKGFLTNIAGGILANLVYSIIKP